MADEKKLFTRFRRARAAWRGVEEEAGTEEEAEIAEYAGPKKTQDQPKGVVFRDGRLDVQGVRAMMARRARPRKFVDLRRAASLPLVEAIVRTISRDVLSCSLEIRYKEAAAAPPKDIAARQQLERVLMRPMDGETWRTHMSRTIQNLLIVGCADVEVLRRRGGRANEVLEAARREGTTSFVEIAQALKMAVRQRGDVVGWAVYDPSNIMPDIDSHGVYRSPAFYDFAHPVDDKTWEQLEKKDAVARWNKRDFTRILYAPDPRARYYGRSRSPVEAAWAIIDIIFHLFYRYREQLINPVVDKLVSFTVPPASALSPAQTTDIVTTMRADILEGRLPVLEGLKVEVHDLRRSWAKEPLSPLEQLQVILWTIFGAGLIEMGKVETATRSTAEQQVALSRRQAVGGIKRILVDEVAGIFIHDSFSPYGGLDVVLSEADLPLSQVELLSDIIGPLVDIGVPPGVVLQHYFPEIWHLCVQAGITDPLSLIPVERRGRPPGEVKKEEPSEESAEVTHKARAAMESTNLADLLVEHPDLVSLARLNEQLAQEG